MADDTPAGRENNNGGTNQPMTVAFKPQGGTADIFPPVTYHFDDRSYFASRWLNSMKRRIRGATKLEEEKIDFMISHLADPVRDRAESSVIALKIDTVDKFEKWFTDAYMPDFTQSVSRSITTLKQTLSLAMYMDHFLAILTRNLQREHPTDDFILLYFFYAGLRDQQFASALKASGVTTCDQLQEKINLQLESGLFNGFGARIGRGVTSRSRDFNAGRGRGKNVGYANMGRRSERGANSSNGGGHGGSNTFPQNKFRFGAGKPQQRVMAKSNAIEATTDDVGEGLGFAPQDYDEETYDDDGYLNGGDQEH